ncbi:hypothetical protein P153DRAFT_371548 [Dothidotthia symphoricarpi CBS 119687]|uniref:Uncharacterized protein n=1 Tax=Dothidotthia symphoricarpi CBS 119687 TaxID=1392245 RepID=A0A6A5ZXS0_9PLEO|nr:uncharacterized protein P153DRAFT_371548 [Dothidotthia symphoricarpi CBS 119687]KAF2123567.1 hypothetical protein P153DRAFT_371548 [Dothidotthia symphoricarpi CBS 119687]
MEHAASYALVAHTLDGDAARARFTETWNLLRAPNQSTQAAESSAAADTFWVAAVYAGVHSHFGLTLEQFTHDSDAPEPIRAAFVRARGLSPKARIVRCLASIHDCWPPTFLARLLDASIPFPHGADQPTIGFVETLQKLARLEEFDVFVASFPPFLARRIATLRFTYSQKALADAGKRTVTPQDLREYIDRLTTRTSDVVDQYRDPCSKRRRVTKSPVAPATFVSTPPATPSPTPTPTPNHPQFSPPSPELARRADHGDFERHHSSPSLAASQLEPSIVEQSIVEASLIDRDYSFELSAIEHEELPQLPDFDESESNNTFNNDTAQTNNMLTVEALQDAHDRGLGYHIGNIRDTATHVTLAQQRQLAADTKLQKVKQRTLDELHITYHDDYAVFDKAETQARAQTATLKSNFSVADKIDELRAAIAGDEENPDINKYITLSFDRGRLQKDVEESEGRLDALKRAREEIGSAVMEAGKAIMAVQHDMARHQAALQDFQAFQATIASIPLTADFAKLADICGVPEGKR